MTPRNLWTISLLSLLVALPVLAQEGRKSAPAGQDAKGTVAVPAGALQDQPQKAEPEVSVYVSLDEEHSAGILKLFETETGIKVRYNPDTEDNKTIGLVNKIIAEGRSPIADVFWNNECGQTERLKAKGLLEAYASPSAADIPAKFKDPEGYWTGFAARARVLVWNRDRIKAEDLPRRMEDLADPKFASQLAMAKPLTGTTYTHVGALYVAWGAAKTDAWLDALQKQGVRWERGNAQVARLVADGEKPFGLTDTDDVNVKRLEKFPVEQVLLDQGDGGIGALLIPNSVMILKNARHPVAARRLVDFLLSPRVEQLLAEGRSAQVPLHPGVPAPANVVAIQGVRTMDADWPRVGAAIEAHKLDLERRFLEAVPAKDAPGGVPSIVFAIVALAVAIGFALLALYPRRLRKSAGP